MIELINKASAINNIFRTRIDVSSYMIKIQVQKAS